MSDNTIIGPLEVKKRSEKIILDVGGRICDWLPMPEQSEPRSLGQLIGRALVMNAMLNICFLAPVPVIRTWIERNGLENHLSNSERVLLTKSNDQLARQELINLYWHIEALWALMWAGNLIEHLDFTRPVEDYMASLAPNLQVNKNGDMFSKRMRLRPYNELYNMLDLHYRLHWYARDGQLNGYSTGAVSLDIIMERRKALEWFMDASSDWDHIDLST